MIPNGVFLGTERTETFSCKKCDFYTCHFGHWKRHLETKKHSEAQMIPFCPNQVEQNESFQCSCKKTYKYRQGYYRHKKKCNLTVQETDTVKECLITMREMAKAMTELSKNPTTITNNHVHNNTNIMVYLNEKYSNALSIQDFIDKLTLTLSDLNDLKQDKPRAIASIVRQNLAPLSINNRPMHNVNNKDWYIKDKMDGWQEDTGEKMVKNVELGILKNWTKVYENSYPEWFKTDKEQNEFIELTNLTTSEMEPRTVRKLIKSLEPVALLTQLH
jgi:hypothetical protein